MKYWVNIDWDAINSQYTLSFVQTLKPPYFLKVNLPTDQATSPKIQKPVGQVLKILGGTVASKKTAIWSGFHIRRQSCLEFEKMRELYMVLLWLYPKIVEIGACLYYGKKPVQYPLWVTLVAFGFQAWLAPTVPSLLTFRRGCYAPCLKMIDTKWNNFQVELFWWKGTGVICVACCWWWITSIVPYPSPFFAIQDTSNPHGAISSRAMVRQKESQEMMQTWPSIASWLIPQKNNSNHPFHGLWPGVLPVSTNCVLCHVTSLVGPLDPQVVPHHRRHLKAAMLGPCHQPSTFRTGGEFSRKEKRIDVRDWVKTESEWTKW